MWKLIWRIFLLVLLFNIHAVLISNLRVCLCAFTSCDQEIIEELWQSCKHISQLMTDKSRLVWRNLSNHYFLSVFCQQINMKQELLWPLYIYLNFLFPLFFLLFSFASILPVIKEDNTKRMGNWKAKIPVNFLKIIWDPPVSNIELDRENQC